MCMYSVCVGLCAYECGVLGGLEALDLPGAGVTGDCKLPDVLGAKPQVLNRQVLCSSIFLGVGGRRSEGGSLTV